MEYEPPPCTTLYKVGQTIWYIVDADRYGVRDRAHPLRFMRATVHRITPKRVVIRPTSVQFRPRAVTPWCLTDRAPFKDYEL